MNGRDRPIRSFFGPVWRAVVAVALGLGVLTVASAPASAAVPVAGGTYQINVLNSGKCMEVQSGTTDNGALLRQWQCTQATWQRYRLQSAGSGVYTFASAHTGKCLEIRNGTTEMFAQVQQWDCTGAAWQRWRLVASGTDSYQIVNDVTGLCLSNKDAGQDNGVAIVQETCTANTNKRWRFAPDGSTQQPTVAADGTGLHRTVQAAVDAAPTNSPSRILITIKPGTYRGVVTVPSNKPNITFEGLGTSPSQVLIVNNHSAYTHGTSGSATAFLNGRDFLAVNLTISNDFDENSTPEGHQAVAVNLGADRAVFRDVRLLGDQDTFLVNDSARAYMVDSYVEGTVDFIFGGGTMVFHRTSVYEKRSTGGPITAASTAAEKRYGLMFYQSTITGSGSNNTTLGRPWRPNAQVLYRETSLSGTIRTSQPWTDMSDNSWRDARFLEYRNTGAGAGTNSNRPQLSDAQAGEYTPQKYLAGTDGWNPIG
ncbi:pectin esterase [Actinophytocola xinjiangensis]|uniref:Pectinesterase n=1 Tax=Actinophytocola xinjiangensis TaxID=485602 RepID=A0A7Z0WMA3_9PSEU|nr:pectinesterase family protein [Actinophytocola xinjiangensis]OLF10695.1 pectin esterase [Actinophytocola xinjiangensis]